ncbi:54S ribosomal protein L49, mitochondrial [[Candida] railenensis]|uniref:Large ribosomal subunit protein bL21m n=1 Tax=[Candida] railenensis TaxID=45579 RepID=A0A9P0QUF4_9ASCO|nr:54S ribosomal protein L49, mitochondrial [[Candida] railenensis]
MFARTFQGALSLSSRRLASTSAKIVPDLVPLKLDSIGSQSLYSVISIYNKKYLVTKGDKIILPFKLKDAEVGDSLIFNQVLTLGSPQYTYHDAKGIPQEAYNIQAKVVEITREPYYEVIRKKQRCRRGKTIPVEPYQTHLMINELKLT